MCRKLSGSQGALKEQRIIHILIYGTGDANHQWGTGDLYTTE